MNQEVVFDEPILSVRNLLELNDGDYFHETEHQFLK